MLGLVTVLLTGAGGPMPEGGSFNLVPPGLIPGVSNRGCWVVHQTLPVGITHVKGPNVVTCD